MGKYILFYKTYPIEAEIIREKLESFGIPVKIHQEAYGKITGLSVDGLGEVEILIDEEYFDRAKEIIDNINIKKQKSP